MTTLPEKIELIPIDKIHILNPRARSHAKWIEIVQTIQKIGLKKPITVSHRRATNGCEPGYDLVCGQGRLEAYIELGASEVPAVVIDVPLTERYLMSLVENLARRQQSSVSIMEEILRLSNEGYRAPEIATKTGLSRSYVTGMLRLLKKGEDFLIQAVEAGRLPVSVAVEVAKADDAAVQAALTKAYESGSLRGKSLERARRVIEQRKRRRKRTPAQRKKRVSAREIVRLYEAETTKQRGLIAKARVCEARILFIVEAMRELLSEDAFVDLLQREELRELPKPLVDRLRRDGRQ